MDVPEIDVDELARRHASGRAVLDVREPDEYEGGHVPGAVSIPLGEVPDRLGEVPDGEVLVICAKGGRSRKAAELLRAGGVDAVNVAGGTTAWVESGRPVAAGSAPG
jgi:rhodanese-related sulfurtransferase